MLLSGRSGTRGAQEHKEKEENHEEEQKKEEHKEDNYEEQEHAKKEVLEELPAENASFLRFNFHFIIFARHYAACLPRGTFREVCTDFFLSFLSHFFFFTPG